LSGLREQELIYIKEREVCDNGYGCDWDKLHTVNCNNEMTIIATCASESHCNNTLKTAIAFARYLGPDQSFYEIRTKDKITDFLDTKIKDNVTDPEKRGITTWNDYHFRPRIQFNPLTLNYKFNIPNLFDYFSCRIS
jgi:hypothetical protein